MEIRNMKKVFYYLRKLTGEGRHPYACVCVVQNDDGIISRGVAVCSPDDHFSKEIGRAKALGYAIRALNYNNIQNEKRSKIAKMINSDIINFGDFQSNANSNEFSGKYIQSSLLFYPNDQKLVATPKTFIPLTDFEKKLLENG